MAKGEAAAVVGFTYWFSCPTCPAWHPPANPLPPAGDKSMKDGEGESPRQLLAQYAAFFDCAQQVGGPRAGGDCHRQPIMFTATTTSLLPETAQRMLYSCARSQEMVAWACHS
jgi:hypothetical protein